MVLFPIHQKKCLVNKQAKDLPLLVPASWSSIAPPQWHYLDLISYYKHSTDEASTKNGAKARASYRYGRTIRSCPVIRCLCDMAPDEKPGKHMLMP
jgi:hypothetical protein